MQEETNTNAAHEQQNVSALEHNYYEVGRELLSKPNLLGDLVELEAGNSILVFCNTPSDTDFVEVMLKKRGVSAQKLIGNVPQPKLERAIEQVKNKELSVIVLTDIAARNLDFSLFQAVINYSVPQDPETYIDRCGCSKPGAAIKKIATLVTALELANFHYLKKGLGFEPVQSNEPDQKALLAARINGLKAIAAKEPAVQDENLRQIVSLVLADSNKDDLITLLLHNTLSVLPALRSAANKQNEPSDDIDMDDRPERGSGRRRDSRDRDGREDRGNRSYGNRGDGGNRSRRSRSNYDDNNGSYEGLPRIDEDGELVGDDSGDSGDSGYRRHSRDRGDSRGGERGGRGGRSDRRSDAPLKKDARVYLGIGSQDQFSKDDLIKVLKETSTVEDSDIKHISIRGHYSFFDINDQKSDGVLEHLSNATGPNGKSYAASKAISINAVSAEDKEQNTGGDNQDADAYEEAPAEEHVDY